MHRADPFRRDRLRTASSESFYAEPIGEERGTSFCVRLFHAEARREYAASIVDPHGDHLADAMPKLVGLADFAETYGDALMRVEAISKVDDELRMLNLKDAWVREAVRTAKEAKGLYRGEVAVRY